MRKLQTIWLLCGLAWPALALEYPATRAGQAAQTWVEAFAAGDPTLQTWIETWRDKASLARTPMNERLARFAQVREAFGVLVADRILEADDQHIVLLLRSESGGGWVNVRFTLQTSFPFQVTEMAIAPTAPPADAGPAFGGWADVQELLGKARQAAGSPAIAAALLVDGKLVLQAVDGLRVVGEPDSVRPADPFHIGSITKSCTGVLVARCVERGLLNWDDTLQELLPDMPMLEVYRAVRIDQLLRHRGAIPPYTQINAVLDAELKKLPADPVLCRQAFVARVLQEPASGQPDAAMLYSNAGFALLGHIVERLDGRPWEQQIREEIFAPLKLESAGFGWPASAQHPDRPRGHWAEGQAPRPQPLDDSYVLGHYLAPAGDIHCSVADLARYGAAHLRALRGEDSILKQETAKRLHDPGPAKDANYAGGWIVESDGTQWHNGTMARGGPSTPIWCWRRKVGAWWQCC